MGTNLDLSRTAVNHWQSGRLEEAEAICQQILQANPNEPNTLNLLGSIAQKREKYDTAIEFFEAARLSLPSEPGILHNLALAYRCVQRMDDSIECCRRSLELLPENADTYCIMGHAFKNLGKTEEAVAAYRHAIRCDSVQMEAYKGLGDLAAAGEYHFDDQQIDRMESLLATENLAANSASSLHFTLAGILHERGDIDRAFLEYRKANESKRETLRQQNRNFDPTGFALFVDQLILTFDRSFFQRVRPLGLESDLAVFIVGMPRSGTTLVEQILASHPLVHGAGELKYITELITDLPCYDSTITTYPSSVPSMSESVIRSLATHYTERLSRLAPNARRITDKMPSNSLNLGFIRTLLPNARVIHCVRDAMDVCWSCYRTSLKDPFTNDFEDLAAFHHQYERLMKHWKEVSLPRIFPVDYEELVRNQEDVSRALVDFCGLDWDERCLDFHKNSRPVRTASMLQIRRPIFRSSVRQWKRYEAHLGPLIEALGYSEAEN